MSIGNEKDRRTYCPKHEEYKVKLMSGSYECVHCLRNEKQQGLNLIDTSETIFGWSRYYFMNVIVIPTIVGIVLVIYSFWSITLLAILGFAVLIQALYRIMVELTYIGEQLE